MSGGRSTRTTSRPTSPATSRRSTPTGSPREIPAGADLSFQIHYTPNGTAQVDQSRLGLIFAPGPVEHEAHTHHILNARFRIPPGEPNHEVTSTWTVPRPVHLLSLSPHMHLRGKDFKYTATFPDGRTEVLLSVPAYDFGWQSVYVLDQAPGPARRERRSTAWPTSTTRRPTRTTPTRPRKSAGASSRSRR